MMGTGKTVWKFMGNRLFFWWTFMGHQLGVSENSVPLNPMVLLIIIPFLNGYFIGNINPTFSDKPNCFLHGKFLGTHLGRLWKHWTFWEVLGNHWTWWRITPAILWEYSSDGICKDSNIFQPCNGWDGLIVLVDGPCVIMESCIVFFREAGETLWTTSRET